MQILAHLPLIQSNMPPNVSQQYEILISVVTFDLFGYWVENVNFGQTETDAYNESFNYLKYDSLNILTNMVSIHIFVAIVVVHSAVMLILQMRCCECMLRLRLCRAFRRSLQRSVAQTFVIGIFRIMYTGFLEIFLCTYIGLGIFEIKEMTDIDKLTACVNIFYVFNVAVFIGIMLWFIFYKVRPLIHFKATRDKLEHYQILKLIMQKILGPELNQQMQLSDHKKFQCLRRAITKDI